MSEQMWYKPEDKEPSNGQVVDWLDSTGYQITGGKFNNGLWLLPCGVYIYYMPTFWRPNNDYQLAEATP